MISSKRITELFLSLSQIDSPSFGERKMANRLASELRKLGLSVKEDNAAEIINGSAGNLYAYLPGDTDAPPLLFSGHMDTVEPACGKKAVLHPDGTITSDGTTVLGADDISGITAILEALASIKEDGASHRPLEILFTAAEEPYDFGSEALDYSLLKSKEAYVLDLSGPVGGAAYAAPAICSFSINISGKSSHAGFAPEKGVHAIAIAAKAISSLKMGHIDDKTTLSIGKIRGGTATNIVPDTCLVEGEIRSSSDDEAKRTLDSVIKTFAEAADAFGGSYEIKSRFGCHAYKVPRDHRIIRRFLASCDETGVKPNLFPTFGGSDANQFAKHGITGLVIACAMYEAHSCREFTKVQDLEKVSQTVQSLMLSQY